jgi:FkbM family methyltransferase
MISNRIISYAQNREDVILQGFFDTDETGFYVDIGAYDPDEDSVTKHFYLKGWRGINVEPQPDRYALFVDRRPEDTNVNCGVSDAAGKLTLRSYDNQGLSTFSKKVQSRYEKDSQIGTGKYKDITVKVVTLKQLFEDHNVKSIQFLKVDVEGLEYEVLAGNDWKQYRPEVLCIEITHTDKDWEGLLKRNGYSFVFSDGVNTYYTDDKTGRAKKFDYVEDVVFKEPIVNHKLLEDYERYEKHIAWLESTIENLRQDNEAATAQMHHLQRTINELTPLRRHLKRQVRHHIGRADKKIVRKLSRKSEFKPVGGSVRRTEGASLESLLDAAGTYDSQNFERYHKAAKPRALLPVYMRSRNATYKGLRRMKQKVRRRS